ncbi:MAG: leucine--tRNA ligase, partial [Haloferacaceae archaeon]
TPYLGEELWNLLDGDGPLATARWPTPEYDVSEYCIERQLVASTLEDVRDITEVVDIDAPERIELVVAPAWKFRAYDLAREADPNEALVGRLMDEEAIRAHGEAAADYAATLADRQPGLEPVVDGDDELAILERARWLFADEFGADVTVRRARDEGDDLGRKAEPNRPAIHIE